MKADVRLLTLKKVDFAAAAPMKKSTFI